MREEERVCVACATGLEVVCFLVGMCEYARVCTCVCVRGCVCNVRIYWQM